MLALRSMTAADVPFGLRLCRQAGWNQTEADWRRFLALEPDGCFIATWDGTPVGTTAAFVFGPVAWIAAVLVDADQRSRGIGRALMVHALDYLQQRGVQSVRLDATPLGQPLYESLGFVEQYRLARYHGTPSAAPAAAGVGVAERAEWPELCRLDAAITATDRAVLLQRLFEEQPADVRLVRKQRDVVGFRASRPGFHATLLGPCIAAPEVGPALFADACHRHQGEAVYVDIPCANRAACMHAEQQGLVVQRQLTRMCRGVPLCERVDWLWASSGPEQG
jgi:GNAT superfamily N-acetyltransferase